MIVWVCLFIVSADSCFVQHAQCYSTPNTHKSHMPGAGHLLEPSKGAVPEESHQLTAIPLRRLGVLTHILAGLFKYLKVTQNT